jgi:hypothetical protein
MNYDSKRVRSLRRRAERFSSAVLTWIDASGFPFSIRCRPVIGPSGVRIDLSNSIAAEPGRAGLLYHSHNDKLWRLRMLLVVGLLEREGRAWVFHPQKIITGVAGVNKLHMLRSLVNARRTASRYLNQRHMPRPEVQWKRIRELQRELND